VPCPCRLSGLVPAEWPAQPKHWRCPECDWIFIHEMTGGEDPLKLDTYLRCPKHQRAPRAAAESDQVIATRLWFTERWDLGPRELGRPSQAA
jgi:hypothetical protein